MPKKKNDLMDILSDYNPKRSSDGQIFIKCPFRDNHLDGSGQKSFHISPDKNVYHCFSCGQSGALTALLTTKFDIDFHDAFSLVGNEGIESKKKKEFELDIIWNLTPPESFLKRGFKQETLKHFRLGTTDDGWTIIPFYKDFNKVSSLVGYQRRKDKTERIVMNNEGFDKKSYLYNFDTSYKYTILVEGYSDAMRLYQYGYNSTALLGTQLSDEHIEMLKQFDKIYLALDNDNPGVEATERCYWKLSEKGFEEILFIPYLTKDPGECISPVVWDNAFSQSTYYRDYTREMDENYEAYPKIREKVLKQLHINN